MGNLPIAHSARTRLNIRNSSTTGLGRRRVMRFRVGIATRPGQYPAGEIGMIINEDLVEELRQPIELDVPKPASLAVFAAMKRHSDALLRQMLQPETDADRRLRKNMEQHGFRWNVFAGQWGRR